MNKIKEVNELHNKAMVLAEEAFLLEKVHRKREEAIAIYQKAFELEKSAALLLVADYDVEPTRSVLFKGAANLAFNGNLHREAERMIGFGLSGNPPTQIAQELRDLMAMIKTSTDITEHSPIDKFKQLPENLQNEVSDFIDFLLIKHGTASRA